MSQSRRSVFLKSIRGKLLRVDLSKRKIRTKALGENVFKRFIGGKGLGIKVLLEETDPQLDPLSPANTLIFMTGPVNGTLLSGAAKFGVFFKSPLTGIFGESYCGGYFAAQLKFAGYDGLMVQGKAERPVYISIKDGEAEIKNANHIWGKDTFETEDIIKEELDEKFQVLSIGPAGENLVKYACISHAKGREFGRCGAGAVMGSKNLKAIAVLGTGRIEAARTEDFEEFKKELNSKIKEHLRSLKVYGTPAIIGLTNATGTLPTRNWTEGEFDGYEKISAETLKTKLFVKSKSCFACSVACRKVSAIKDGPYAGTWVEGPEYETLFAFGSLCGNDNLESIVKANEICDRLGIDTISAGNVIAFAMECYEKGIITPKDADQIKLDFGNHEAIIQILRKIAYRKGLGKVLAEGTRKASQIIGRNSEKFAVHVKGLELPGYDPRGLKGVALAYAVSCRGACHLRHMAYRPNLTGTHPFQKGEVDRLSYAGQARMVKEQEDFYSLIDSIGLCRFVCLPTIGPILWKELVRLYWILTSVKVKKENLVRIAVRVNNMAKQYNIQAGVRYANDSLPERLLKEPLKKGQSAGQVVSKRKLEKMLDEYYRFRKRRKVTSSTATTFPKRSETSINSSP